jgi:hypothetical protein
LKDHGDTLHVTVFIDDFLCSSKNLQTIKSLEKSIVDKYTEITFPYGKVHEYLGLDLSVPMEVTMKMTNKVEQLLKDFNISKSAASPGSASPFPFSTKSNCEALVSLHQHSPRHLSGSELPVCAS